MSKKEGWRGLSPPHAEAQGREGRLFEIKGEMVCGEDPFQVNILDWSSFHGQGLKRQGQLHYQLRGCTVFPWCSLEGLRISWSSSDGEQGAG